MGSYGAQIQSIQLVLFKTKLFMRYYDHFFLFYMNFCKNVTIRRKYKWLTDETKLLINPQFTSYTLRQIIASYLYYEVTNGTSTDLPKNAHKHSLHIFGTIPEDFNNNIIVLETKTLHRNNKILNIYLNLNENVMIIYIYIHILHFGL